MTSRELEGLKLPKGNTVSDKPPTKRDLRAQEKENRKHPSVEEEEGEPSGTQGNKDKPLEPLLQDKKPNQTFIKEEEGEPSGTHGKSQDDPNETTSDAKSNPRRNPPPHPIPTLKKDSFRLGEKDDDDFEALSTQSKDNSLSEGGDKPTRKSGKNSKNGTHSKDDKPEEESSKQPEEDKSDEESGKQSKEDKPDKNGGKQSKEDKPDEEEKDRPVPGGFQSSEVGRDSSADTNEGGDGQIEEDSPSLSAAAKHQTRLQQRSGNPKINSSASKGGKDQPVSPGLFRTGIKFMGGLLEKAMTPTVNKERWGHAEDDPPKTPTTNTRPNRPRDPVGKTLSAQTTPNKPVNGLTHMTHSSDKDWESLGPEFFFEDDYELEAHSSQTVNFMRAEGLVRPALRVELAVDNKSCYVCSKILGNREGEEFPVVLHCGHMMGRLCIENDISDNSLLSKCPICDLSMMAMVAALVVQSTRLASQDIGWQEGRDESEVNETRYLLDAIAASRVQETESSPSTFSPPGISDEPQSLNTHRVLIQKKYSKNDSDEISVFEGEYVDIELREGSNIVDIDTDDGIWIIGTNSKNERGNFPSGCIDKVGTEVRAKEIADAKAGKVKELFEAKMAAGAKAKAKEIADAKASKVKELFEAKMAADAEVKRLALANAKKLVAEAEAEAARAKAIADEIEEANLAAAVKAKELAEAEKDTNGEYALVIKNHVGSDTYDLDLRVGEILSEVEVVGENWSFGTNQSGKTGFFPSLCIKIVQKPSAKTAAEIKAAMKAKIAAERRKKVGAATTPVDVTGAPDGFARREEAKEYPPPPKNYVISEDRENPGRGIYKHIEKRFTANSGFRLLLKCPSPLDLDLWMYDLDAAAPHKDAETDVTTTTPMSKVSILEGFRWRDLELVAVASVRQSLPIRINVETSKQTRKVPKKAALTILGLKEIGSEQEPFWFWISDVTTFFKDEAKEVRAQIAEYRAIRGQTRQEVPSRFRPPNPEWEQDWPPSTTV
ncbi:hypothetical protein ACEPPN_000325 [Leptodophora sp. 'Broadleaf-Isolate-01']